MEPTREEKTQRLYVALQEALDPIIGKIEKLEREMSVIQKNQEEIKNLLSEKPVK